MKQLSQDRKSGEMILAEVPAPGLHPRGVLVRTAWSVISAGTERATVEQGRESLVKKALRSPEKVRELLGQALTEGPASVIEKVQGKLTSLTPLGYSAAGVVLEVGPGAPEFRVGDRVACAGPRAAHAEILSVPANLCVPVPAGVSLRHASAATLGAIALQGVRQADVRVGENVAVIGLGLLGQLTVQLLRAAGCRVLACDLSPARLQLAMRLGAQQALAPGSDDPASALAALTRGLGFDAVLLTASTSSNAPLVLAGELARDRARVVIVGTVGGEVPRSPYYEKELSVRFSRSYGPGRYDPTYEDHGVDYPVGYVRWTERRNMEGFLDLLVHPGFPMDELLTHSYPLDRAREAYEHVTGSGEALGLLLEYPEAGSLDPAIPAMRTTAVGPAHATVGHGRLMSQKTRPPLPRRDRLGVGFLGAGSFAQNHLLPHLRRDSSVDLVAVCNASGLSARGVASQFSFQSVEESTQALLAREDVHAVCIATRHDSHAELVCKALAAGKSVFVEKPLALDLAELTAVFHALEAHPGMLCVGFNRRFAPLVCGFAEGLRGAAPLGLQYRVNAGSIPASHWTQDPRVGGGRILGECCHFFDLLAHLAGSRMVRISADCIPDPGRPAWASDNAVFQATHENGSLSVLTYWSGGARGFPKESLEVFGAGFAGRMDDFRSGRLDGPSGSREWKQRVQDKGHAEEMRRFVLAARGEAPPPIPVQELLDSSLATLAAARALITRCAVEL